MAPFTATYFFTFSGYSQECDGNNNKEIQQIQNGVQTGYFYHYGNNHHLTHQWMVELRAGDEYKLRTNENWPFYSTSSDTLVLTGQLVYLNE